MNRKVLLCSIYPINQLLFVPDTMVDRFGTGSEMRHCPQDKHPFVVTTKITISDLFYGWLCGFRKMAKVISPPDVVSDFQKLLNDIYGRYEVN